MQQQPQQPHQGGGTGSPYGAPQPPDMGPFSPPAAASGAMPLSSRPPSSSQPQQQQQLRTPSYEELTAVSGGAGGFPDDEMVGGGGTGGSGASGGGNRWPREETLALIRIRSEMDATFRDATLKGPLWEDVSRKLAELGYKRSAKKCKEKFENVHKYYKRTKEGRAGRQDGKSYRFFSELEALHAAAGAQAQQPQQHLPPATSAPTQLNAFAGASVVSAPPPMNSLPPSSAAPMQPAPISAAAPAPAPLELPPHQPLNLQGLSFSSMSDDSESDDGDSDDDMTEGMGGGSGEADRVGNKRKRGGGGSRKIMSFFEGLMQQVVERQEEMQRRFLETMEKREAERTAREEAWRRQEVARLNREQDQLAQERAAAASRDAAIIAFLQRVGGGHHPGQVQPPSSIAVAVPIPAPPQMQLHTTPKQQPLRQQHTPPPPPQVNTPQPVKPISSASPLQQQGPQQQHQHKETPPHRHDASSTPRSAPPTSAVSSLELVPAASSELQAIDSAGGASSSRWPKTEVHALIQLRMEMDLRYNETGPKGPLWEEISAGMRRLGYNRSSKRCKEKWENINKYYKKVKESNKKRPEDSKTCPYFHQLEAIYRKKQLSGGNPAANVVATPAAFPPADQLNQSSSRLEIEGKNINDDKRNNGGAQAPTSNGETSPTAALDADGSGTKKPEDIVRELSEQPPPRELTTDETDSDDEYTDDGEEGEDDGKMQYRIQFQRPKSAGATTAPAPSTTTAPAAVQASAPTTANTFAAMVQ